MGLRYEELLQLYFSDSQAVGLQFLLSLQGICYEVLVPLVRKEDCLEKALNVNP